MFLGLVANEQVSRLCLLPYGEGLSQLTGLSVSAESGQQYVWLVPSCDYMHALLMFLGASVIYCGRNVSGMLWSREQEEPPEEQQSSQQAAWGLVLQDQPHAGQATVQESGVNISGDASQAQVVVTE